MTPELYTIISQGISLMNVITAKTQDEKDTPESVKHYAGELQQSVSSLLKVHEEEFSTEGYQQYNAILSEIKDTATELAECCENSECVMQLTGGNLKTLLSRLGDILKNERPIICNKNIFERLKDKFGNH